MDSLSSWLALREAADRAARSAALTQAVAGVLNVRLKADATSSTEADARSSARPTSSAGARAATGPLRVLDLATGTGANVRYLCPRLPVPQQWVVVDRDPVLLAQAPRSTPGCQIEARCLDLGSLDPDLFADRHLVTASALLDLVSDRWLRTLAHRCREVGAVVLFALTYNGHSRCSPEEPEDEVIRELLNAHQRQNDKGLGRAAGPEAASGAARCLAEGGYHVRREPSDWVLSPDTHDLQQQLLEGWAQAAEEMAPEESPRIRDWLARRLAHVRSGRSQIIVCHEDLAAWLP